MVQTIILVGLVIMYAGWFIFNEINTAKFFKEIKAKEDAYDRRFPFQQNSFIYVDISCDNCSEQYSVPKIAKCMRCNHELRA